MNRFTELVWDVLTDDDTWLAELTAIIRKEYQPFLTKEQPVMTNTHLLEHHVLEACTAWVEWLPDTSINRLGGELAMEALHEVESHRRTAPSEVRARRGRSVQAGEQQFRSASD